VKAELNLSKAWLLFRAYLNGLCARAHTQTHTDTHRHTQTHTDTLTHSLDLLLTKCWNSLHLSMRTRSRLLSFFHQCSLSAEGLQGGRNVLWYPLEANLLDNRRMVWLISWSYKG